MKRHEQFTVLGRPFFPVGGQAHNSTSYVLDDLRITFDAVRKLNGNSCAVTICWDRFEPAEGEYDDRSCVIVVEINTMQCGLIVDRVSDVEKVTSEMIARSPVDNGMVRGFVIHEDKTKVSILDPGVLART